MNYGITREQVGEELTSGGAEHSSWTPFVRAALREICRSIARPPLPSVLSLMHLATSKGARSDPWSSLPHRSPDVSENHEHVQGHTHTLATGTAALTACLGTLSPTEKSMGRCSHTPELFVRNRDGRSVMD